MNYFKDQGPLLLVNGYRIVKIAGRGKNPIENGWTKKVVTKEDCENDNAADRSVGIICGEDVMCVDADIYEHELADRIMAVIRKLHPDRIIPTRYGARPKFAMLFRNVDNLPPTRSPMYTKGEGDERVTAQIEFRGKNQQFVAFGIHPATGKEYEWENGSPEFLSVEDLPALTSEDFDKIMQEIDAIARSFGYTPPRSLNSALAKVNEKLTPEDIEIGNISKKYGKTIGQFEKDLRDSDLDPANYNQWIMAGQIGHFEFDADPMAMEAWDKWSQQAPNYKNREEIERKWRSFRSDRTDLVGYGTLLQHIPDGLRREGYVINETTLAIAISEHLKGTIKFIPAANRWMIYEEGHWGEQPVEYVHKRTIHAMDYILTRKKVEYAGNATLKKAVEGLIKSFDKNLPALSDKVLTSLVRIGTVTTNVETFDADRRYFGVGNGDIDLTTGEFLKPDPQRYVSKHTNIWYSPDAECPRWKQTLRECLKSEEDIEYFQKVVGQAALGQTNKRLVVFLYGVGCNGKSTILEVLRAVFGDYQRTASQDVLFGMGGGSTRSDLIDLRGARLIELPETERGGRLNAAQMKRITGGDEISVRAPYAAKQERFSLVGIPFIATNYFPDIKESDEGTWGRISLIEFPRNFENDPYFVKDEHLGEKLALEYEGILNWVIEGALKVQKEGLKKPESMKAEVNEYRQENDLIGQFVSEYLIVDGDKNKRMFRDDLFKLWQVFCQDKGDNGGIKQQKDLTMELTRRYRWGIFKSNNRRGYTGISKRPIEVTTGED